jgi:hypothetical protein
VLILKTAGRIYGLDLGKEHHNPQCQQVGDKHKHRWTEQFHDKEAYVPDDITATAENPVEVWTEFLCAGQDRALRADVSTTRTHWRPFPMNATDLCAELDRGLGELFACAPQGDYCRIRTPYLYPDGDNIDLFCKADGDVTTVSEPW